MDKISLCGREDCRLVPRQFPCPHSLMDKMLACGANDGSSILPGDTTKISGG